MESSPMHRQSPYVTIGGQPVGVSAGAGRSAASTPQPDSALLVAADAFWPRLCSGLRTHRIWLFGGLGAVGLALGLLWLLGSRAAQRP